MTTSPSKYWLRIDGALSDEEPFDSVVKAERWADVQAYVHAPARVSIITITPNGREREISWYEYPEPPSSAMRINHRVPLSLVDTQETT